MQVAPRPERTRLEQALRVACFAVLCVAALVCILHTLRWPMMWDSTVLHYASFLISQGKVPYRDFIEPDLPASYMVETAAMHVFGGLDLGWHLYDLSLLALLTAACISIARPYDWVAGLLAGISFALQHLLYGPRNAGQREEFVTVCLVAAVALLFRANRSLQPWPMLPFGFLIGVAASIKPTACLPGLLAFLLVLLALRKEHVPLSRYIGLALLGLFFAASLSVLFLWRYHAFHAFVLEERLLLPYYTTIGRASIPVLLRAISRYVLLVFLLGLLLAVVQRKATPTENLERVILLLMVACGLLSYLVQRKLFEHHLYTFDAFVLLFFALEAVKALPSATTAPKPAWLHLAGAAALTGVLALMVTQAYRLSRLPGTDPVTPSLTADLTRLGGPSLNGKVQCFDLVLACTSSLYRLHLVESSGVLNDFTVMGPPGAHSPPYFRQRLWDDLQSHPPTVVIVTNQQLQASDSFDKLDQWPQFASFLAAGYSLETTRTFGSSAYRIYVRKPAAGSSTP